MTPKKNFLKTPAAKAHFELSATSNFQQALDACLLQVVADTALTQQNPDEAIARYNQIVGATQFFKTLATLATETPPAPARDTGNLDHRLK